MRDDVSYAEAVAGFRNDLNKLGQTILIIYEDLDRVEDPNVIKKILGISEKIAGDNIKVVYQYDEGNLLEKGFDRRYLEKYIPFTMNLTEISLPRVLNHLFAEKGKESLPVEREDFRFLELPIYPPFSVVNDPLSVSFHIKVPGMTIRKAEHFLNELVLFLKQEGVYRSHKREVILFFLIKHFYYDIYLQLAPGKSLLEIFTFSWQGKEDTIVNWFRFCKKENSDTMIRDIFLAEENRLSALMVSLFEYNCDIYEVERSMEDIVNEATHNIQRQDANNQKDRIVWNLLCNGKSEYTDQKMVVERLRRNVLNKPLEQQRQAFSELWEDLFHGRYGDGEKDDNRTIFLLGVPSMVLLFQACSVAGLTGEQWIEVIRFYLEYEQVTSITPELVECLNYCCLKDRKAYLYILQQFNRLEVQGNLNSHRAYRNFLDHYLSALSVLGYIDTMEVCAVRNREEKELEVSFIQECVLNRLKAKLEKLQKAIPIDKIAQEIDLLMEFLDQNAKLMAAEQRLQLQEVKVKADVQSVLHNQRTIDKLDAEDTDDAAFEQNVLDLYEAEKITPYEIALLKRYKPTTEEGRNRYG